jgi:hypothetical protein
MDVTRECDAGDVAAVKERCRKALRWAITRTYSSEETR